MPDCLYDKFGDILHEVPELEEPLLAWKNGQAADAIRRQLGRRQTKILVKSLGGYEPADKD